MTHLWVRAEQRDNEQRVGLTPERAADLIAAGFTVTVENSAMRAIPVEGYAEAGCAIAPEGSWPDAPADAFIFGLKELPDDTGPLVHRHIMFGHAFKGQDEGRELLKRFKSGTGTLFDLEYLVDDSGKRLAAFGYWAGYAGAAVSLKVWAAQKQEDAVLPLEPYGSADAMLDDVSADLNSTLLPRPSVIVIGAKGRVGSGARDLCRQLGVATTDWDIAETAGGGPFPEILAHDVFLNCIFAAPGTPVFVPQEAVTEARRLTVIGDIACDPGSEFSPIKVYAQTTTWEDPAIRVHDDPPLDVMSIDNLPSLLPVEASQDFAAQLLPVLRGLGDVEAGAWGRAREVFEREIGKL